MFLRPGVWGHGLPGRPGGRALRAGPRPAVAGRPGEARRVRGCARWVGGPGLAGRAGTVLRGRNRPLLRRAPMRVPSCRVRRRVLHRVRPPSAGPGLPGARVDLCLGARPAGVGLPRAWGPRPRAVSVRVRVPVGRGRSGRRRRAAAGAGRVGAAAAHRAASCGEALDRASVGAGWAGSCRGAGQSASVRPRRAGGRRWACPGSGSPDAGPGCTSLCRRSGAAPEGAGAVYCCENSFLLL